MSAQTDLHKLKGVGTGDNVRSVARADRMNALQNISKGQIDGQQIVPTADLNRVIGPGWSIYKNRKLHVTSTSETNFPWKISVVVDAGRNFFARMSPGTVNSIIPSNMFNALPISNAGTWYVTLDVNTDGDSPTNATINASTIIPPNILGSDLNMAPPVFQVILGIVFNGVAFQIIKSALMAIPKLTIQTLVPSPTPGEAIYDNNYTWDVTSI